MYSTAPAKINVKPLAYISAQETGTDWIGLCSVLRPRQHSIGYTGDGKTGTETCNNVVILVRSLYVV